MCKDVAPTPPAKSPVGSLVHVHASLPSEVTSMLRAKGVSGLLVQGESGGGFIQSIFVFNCFPFLKCILCPTHAANLSVEEDDDEDGDGGEKPAVSRLRQEICGCTLTLVVQ